MYTKLQLDDYMRLWIYWYQKKYKVGYRAVKKKFEWIKRKNNPSSSQLKNINKFNNLWKEKILEYIEKIGIIRTSRKLDLPYSFLIKQLYW